MASPPVVADPVATGVDAHDASGITANAKQFKSDGDSFVAQYIDDNKLTASTGGSPSVTQQQVIADSRYLSILSIYQTNGMSSAGGSTAYQTYFTHNQGAIDGTEALESAEALNQPEGSTVYFAFDFDPAAVGAGQTEKQLLTSVQTYLTEVGQVFANSGYKIGVYGAGDTLAAAIRNSTSSPYYNPNYKPVATQGWLTQSYSWAGSGAGDANSQGWAIYQQFTNPNGSTTQNGVSVDIDEATTTALGQWSLCFATGTRIRTSRGDVAVEALVVGDRAVTASGTCRLVRWIGNRTVERLAPEHRPVRILEGAFGRGLPERDLLLSPGHPILVDADEDGTGGHLVPVMLLINGTSIARSPVESITYWHVELDEHDILLAEGLPAESFLDYGNRPWFENGGDFDLLHPDYVAPGLAGRCRPVAFDGPIVEAERRRLDALFAMTLTAQCDWPSEARPFVV